MVEGNDNKSGEASLGDDDKVELNSNSLREVNSIQPQVILYPPLHKKTQNKLEFIL